MAGQKTTKFPVIIPSTVDDAGIAGTLFQQGSFNLLPIAHKSLFRYIIDDLGKEAIRPYIGDIYVVADQELTSRFETQAKGRNNVTVITENANYQRRGILASVNGAVAEKKINRPFLIFYGDSLLQDEVMLHVLKEGDRLARDPKLEGKKWCVVVLLWDREDILAKSLEKNRWAHIVVKADMECVKPGTLDLREPPIWRLREDQILDILYRPTYPELMKPYMGHRHDGSFMTKMSRKATSADAEEVLLESGIMIMSPALWNDLRDVQERRDPLGLRSIPFAARRLLLENEPMTIVGIVTDANFWLDINYPWEYLKANDYLCRRLAAERAPDAEISGIPAISEDSDLNGTGFTVVRNTHQLSQLLEHATRRAYLTSQTTRKPEQIGPAHAYSHEYDSADSWGVHPDVIINGSLILPDPRLEENKDLALYIGSNVSFEGNCVIGKGVRIRSNSIINSSTIGDKCLIDVDCNIDHSVVMSGAKILSGAIVPYSVIGEDAVIGGKSIITCEKLSAVGEGTGDESAAASPAAKTQASGSAGSGDGTTSSPEVDPASASKYYASTTIVRHRHRFGALVGDGVKLGVSTFVQPGRKIGRLSVVEPGVEVREYVPPESLVTSRSIEDSVE